MTTISAASGQSPASSAPCTRSHFETKPAVPGTPTSPRPASTKAAMVSGMVRPSPAMSSILVMPVAKTTQPTAMKSAPLTRA